MEQFSRWYFNLVPLLILLIIMDANSEPNKKLNTPNVYKLSAEKFGKLLDIIANVNEHRINALKRYTALNEYQVGGRILRFVEERKEDTLLAALLFFIENPEAISILHEISENVKDHFDNFEISSEDIEINLREDHEKEGDVIEKLRFKNEVATDEERSGDNKKVPAGTKDALRSSCYRRARKACKKACKSAVKRVCSEYMCSHSMKKHFKKYCKSECKEKLDD